jgi:hypothetical protein
LECVLVALHSAATTTTASSIAVCISIPQHTHSSYLPTPVAKPLPPYPPVSAPFPPPPHAVAQITTHPV